MDPAARRPILEYLRTRPPYCGSGDEPLFLTIQGNAFCENS
jgi:hypothetical protein